MRVLIIEDQENLAKLVKSGLEAEGFSADCVFEGEAGFNRISMNHKDYDLVLLDWMLPKMNGDEICRDVRKKGIDIPILMLTAKDGARDMIAGLDCGADDYLTKPFSFDVLVARIRAILRRPKTTLPVELSSNGITLNPATKKVFREKKEIELTLKEFALLEYLMRNRGVAVTRDQILSNIWDFAFDSFANVVDVHITNLRKKLGDKNAKIVETVRGVGYRMSV
ncbi:MAG TPA: response regulator transcription factor [Candidatus Bathyarchaeia archaeon]|nr:response regulator transcription factor [Candidatus Bathyarchaeia archaeon]